MDRQDKTDVRLPESWKEWTLTEMIGEGSFGAVYKAERISGTDVFSSAVKIIEIPQGGYEVRQLMREMSNEDSVRSYYRNMVEEYLKEIRTMDSLKGITNIVSIEDYYVEEKADEIGWIIYIRMELLESFSEYLTHSTMNETQIIRFGMDICTALQYCEELKIIHRDIKPDNIFVSRLGDFKLGDFGVARTLDRTGSSISVKGNIQFMAPEVYKGEHYGATADIYSLGLLLYKLTNRNRDPFVDPDKQIIYHKERDAAMNRRMEGEPFTQPADASPEFAKVILKAAAYAPEDRYQNAAEFRQDLEKVYRKRTEPGAAGGVIKEPAEETGIKKKKKIGFSGWVRAVCLIVVCMLLIWLLRPAVGKWISRQKDSANTEQRDHERETMAQKETEAGRKAAGKEETETDRKAAGKEDTDGQQLNGLSEKKALTHSPSDYRAGEP